MLPPSLYLTVSDPFFIIIIIYFLLSLVVNISRIFVFNLQSPLGHSAAEVAAFEQTQLCLNCYSCYMESLLDLDYVVHCIKMKNGLRFRRLPSLQSLDTRI